MAKTTQKDLELINEGFRVGYNSSELIEKLRPSFTNSEDFRTAEDYAKRIYMSRSLKELKQVGSDIDSFLKGRELTENPFAYHFIAYAKMIEAQTLFGAFSGADTIEKEDLGYITHSFL